MRARAHSQFPPAPPVPDPPVPPPPPPEPLDDELDELALELDDELDDEPELDELELLPPPAMQIPTGRPPTVSQ